MKQGENRNRTAMKHGQDVRLKPKTINSRREFALILKRCIASAILTTLQNASGSIPSIRPIPLAQMTLRVLRLNLSIFLICINLE